MHSARSGERHDKPFTGKFVVRVSPELHRKIYLSAKLSNESIDPNVAYKGFFVIPARILFY